MKKIITFLFAGGIGLSATAQSQRMVFVEECTQASCAPCASQNPGFNTLLAANTSKVISLKYQTSWPGVDPMNAQNPGDVAARVTYYNVSGVPNATMDGALVPDVAGTSYDGAAAALTQAQIDDQYAVPSPFTMNLTHELSADFDSVYITLTLTASQAVSGDLHLRVALAEKQITFATAPGSNGEKLFYNIMRKMLPDADGTVIAASWNVNDVQTYTFGVPVPSYLYDLRQLNVVAFVQDDATQIVHQSAVTAPQTLAASQGDITVTSLTASSIPTVFCGTTMAPKVNFKNISSTTLTSVTFTAEIDGAVVATQQWTGSLALNGSSSQQFTAFTAPTGGHKLVIRGTLANGVNTDYTLNANYKEATFLNNNGISDATPYVNDLEGATFPGTNEFVNNINGDTYTFKRYNGVDGGFGLSAKCVGLLFYSISSGKVDEYYLPPFDFSTLNDAKLVFSVAHAEYDNTTNDKLEVKVSSNCGTTWTTKYVRSGSSFVGTTPPLSTIAADTTGESFVPTADDWRSDSVDLSAFAGQSQVLVKFVGTSNYGNNLFLDDINLSGADALGAKKQFVTYNEDIFPNPATNEISLSFDNSKSQDVNVNITNTLGSLVSETRIGGVPAGKQLIKLNTSELPTGIYFVEVQKGNERTVHKLTISK
jgi:hypothetical protein